MKDEALRIALEALEGNTTNPVIDPDQAAIEDQAINAIKQALALDKMAENARELGLDYEPVPENFMDALRFDVAMRDAAPVQEPDLIARLKHPDDHYEFTDPKKANAVLMSLCQEAADALAAPVQEHEPENEPFVSLASVQEPVAWMYPDDYERMLTSETFCTVYAVEVGSATRGESSVALYTTPPAQPTPEQYTALEQALTRLQKRYGELEAKVAAQPAVPDAMTSADIQENIEYVAGWNECRQAMLEMTKNRSN